MSQKNCSVYQCRNTYKNTKERPLKVQFYSFPADPERRAKWVKFVDRVKRDGSPWEPTRSSLICSDHFLGNRKSVFPRSPAFNPSVRPGEVPSAEQLRRLELFNIRIREPAQPSKAAKQEPNKDQIDLDEEFDLESPPNSVATQCNLSGGRPYFKDSTGALAHFASTYSVELLYRSTQNANRKVATLTFNQATQVAHKEEEGTKMNRPLLDMIEPPPRYQFRELVYNTPSTAVSINTNTANNSEYEEEEEEEDQKPTLRTYSRKRKQTTSTSAAAAPSPSPSPSPSMQPYSYTNSYAPSFPSELNYLQDRTCQTVVSSRSETRQPSTTTAKASSLSASQEAVAANLAKRETQFLATKYAASLKSTETAEEEVPAYAYAPKPPHLQGNLKRVSDQWEARGKPIIAVKK